MRIPTADNLGQRTPSPSRGAATGDVTQGLDAIGRLAQMGTDIALDIKRNRTLVESAKASTEAIKRIEEKELEFETTDTDYQTQEQRYADFYKELDEEYQQRFENNPNAYNQWKEQVDLYAFKKGLDIKANVFQKDMEQQRGMLRSTLEDVAGIAVRGDEEQYQGALTRSQALLDTALENGVITSAEYQEEANNFNDRLSSLSVERDIIDDPQNALTKLQEDEYAGLTPENRLRYERQARTQIAQNQNKVQYELEKTSRELVDDTVLAYESGFPVTDEEYQAARQAAEVTGESEDLEVARAASEYILLPRAQREALRPEVTGVANAELQKALDDADETINRELDKDGYSFALKQRLIDPIPFDPSNPDSVDMRLAQVDYLESHYGRKISPLTDEEADILVESVDLMTPQDKVAVAQAFGTETALWEQLDDKNAGLFAMAGAIGDPTVMKSIFKGETLISDKLVGSVTKTDYLPVFDDMVGDIYTGKDRKSMLDASLAYYAATSKSPDFDPGDFEKAIEAVSGGIGEINGNKVELPRGVEEDTLDSYFERFTPDMVERFGGAANPDGTPMANEQAAELIQRSAPRSIGNNRYIMESKYGTLYGRNGRPLEISFDEDLYKPIRAELSNSVREQALANSGSVF